MSISIIMAVPSLVALCFPRALEALHSHPDRLTPDLDHLLDVTIGPARETFGRWRLAWQPPWLVERLFALPSVRAEHALMTQVATCLANHALYCFCVAGHYMDDPEEDAEDVVAVIIDSCARYQQRPLRLAVDNVVLYDGLGRRLRAQLADAGLLDLDEVAYGCIVNRVDTEDPEPYADAIEFARTLGANLTCGRALEAMRRQLVKHRSEAHHPLDTDDLLHAEFLLAHGLDLTSLVNHQDDANEDISILSSAAIFLAVHAVVDQDTAGNVPWAGMPHVTGIYLSQAFRHAVAPQVAWRDLRGRWRALAAPVAWRDPRGRWDITITQLWQAVNTWTHALASPPPGGREPWWWKG